jgi:hypothetical protein
MEALAKAKSLFNVSAGTPLAKSEMHAAHSIKHRCLQPAVCKWGYGATVACLTPDQKVGSSSLSALILQGAGVSL